MAGVTQFKFFGLIAGIFASILITSSIASTRIISFPGGLIFDAGTILFPFSYIFNDLLTEVYGYNRSRQVIWTGFMGLILMVVTLGLAGLFPPAPGWELSRAWGEVLGVVPRLALASLCAYLVGEFVNSYVLAKLKIKTKGTYLWFRLVCSSMLGQVFDTLIFASIAFIGVLSWDMWFHLVWSNYIFKVGVEIILLPLTIIVVGYLKKTEKIDYYDYFTDFSPFRWKK